MRRKDILEIAIGLIIGFNIVLPVLTGKNSLDYLTEFINNEKAPIESLGDIEPEPYIYVAPTIPGTFGYYKINETFYRNWLNNTVVWKVEKSIDNVHWLSYNKFTVKKDWDSKSLSEKHTVVVTSDEDAYYRILTNTRGDIKTYEDRSVTNDSFNKSNDFTMKFDTYTISYNWSDYINSKTAAESTFDKKIATGIGNTQYFEWSVVSLNKIKNGGTFVLDPLYGAITDTVVASYEYDAQEARLMCVHPFVRLGTSEYYLTSAFGDVSIDYDGFLRTVRVWNDNGTIQNAVISSYEYDASDGQAASVYHVYGDIYAVIYADVASSIGKIITVRVYDTNGTIIPAVIDTVNLAYNTDRAFTLTYVTDHVYAAVYEETGGGYDYQIETFWINDTGTINDAHLDIEEFDATPTEYMYVGDSCAVDSDTIAIIWQTQNWTSWVCTYNISSAGIITDDQADAWQYESSTSAVSRYPSLAKISDNVFAISYKDGDADGWTGTIYISDAGKLNYAWIDTLEWADATSIWYAKLFPINDADIADDGFGVYAVTYKDADYDGKLVTFNITNTGVIGAAVIDTIEFDATDNVYNAILIHVNKSWHVICHQSTGEDGFIRTVEILTNWACPVISDVAPANYAIDIMLMPSCNITVNDTNGDLMNIMWESFVGATWVVMQTNNSVPNGTYRWIDTDAIVNGCLYSWRVSVSDGYCNTSSVYVFTTWFSAGEEWKTSATWNGTIYNQSWFKPVATWNGSVYNNSWFKTINTWNGTLYNTSWFKTISTWNGTLYNTTYWVQVNVWNGTIYNNSWFKTINAWNGTIYNLSYWFNSSVWNGTIYNISNYLVVSNWNGTIYNNSWFKSVVDWNGTIYNTSWFKTLMLWNGTIYNTTSLRVISTWNGSIYNTSWFKSVANWNGTIYNVSWFKSLVVWNGTIYNTTILIGTVTDEYPVNESNVSYSNIGFPTCINFTYPVAPTGLNITWWSNASGTWNVYGSEYIFENGTYCAFSTNFSGNTTYHWNVSVSNGTAWINESYWFNTTNVTTGTGITLSYSWVVGPIIMYGGLAIFYWRRCKRRKKEV